LINTNKSTRKARLYLRKKRSSYSHKLRAYEDKYGKIKNERKKKKDDTKAPKKVAAKK
jgi:hypothetical protein